LAPIGKCEVPRIVISAEERDNELMRRHYGAEYATHHKQRNQNAFEADLKAFFTKLELLQEAGS
jgi:hypothetical protein